MDVPSRRHAFGTTLWIFSFPVFTNTVVRSLRQGATPHVTAWGDAVRVVADLAAPGYIPSIAQSTIVVVAFMAVIASIH